MSKLECCQNVDGAHKDKNKDDDICDVVNWLVNNGG